MKDLFITSTLKSPWNLEFNPRLCTALEAVGLRCHLPQRDTNQAGTPDGKYEQNLGAIRAVPVVIGVAMNETPNWGAEIGYAYGIGKKIIFLTDRSHEVPVMTRGMCVETFRAEPLEMVERYAARLAECVRKACG